MTTNGPNTPSTPGRDRDTVAIDPPAGSDTTSTPHTWFHNHRHHTSNSLSAHHQNEKKPKRQHNWSFKPREWNDQDEPDWWFASTGIPLLAATLGPLANVLSIAALVTPWRMCVLQNVTSGPEARDCNWSGDAADLSADLEGRTFRDPEWCYRLNVISLVLGFVGNFFLLCNFTNRIKYIIALPATIVLWYLATGILIGITVAMNTYAPPTRPQQTFSQGLWYAVLAAIMYLVCSMTLMVNMLGYFLGHYPDYFTLTESQRTLILQTMLFFFWLAGGAAMFTAVETQFGDGTQPWNYANALYFCDVTILTVGFGDLFATSDIGRGLVFPYSVGGFIMLGLTVSSITKFASELGSEKIIGHHIERSRAKTIGRTVATSMELVRKGGVDGERPDISAPFDPEAGGRRVHPPAQRNDSPPPGLLRKTTDLLTGQKKTTPKLILLRNEKDRFNKMREIQAGTKNFKNWYALTISITAFGMLWCLGAVVFWIVEADSQQLTYFQALYFCYVSLLTIGYGDLAPQTNVGRPFFVVWSLIAVPTMTILISDMGDTIIAKFKKGSNQLADITVLPKVGIWHHFRENIHWIRSVLEDRRARHAAEDRMETGFHTGAESLEQPPQTIEELATEELSLEELAHNLVLALRKATNDLVDDPDKRYTYEEWVSFTKLIRFTARDQIGEAEEGDEDLIEWDWIGEDSPMMQSKSEPQFVFDRLSESMMRYVKRAGAAGVASVTGDEEKR